MHNNLGPGSYDGD